MLIYGGHSARLRGQPFRAGESDIDIYMTAAEADDFEAWLSEHCAKALPVRMRHPETADRCTFSAASRFLPGWRFVEVEIVGPDFAALIGALPDSAPLTFYGQAAMRSSLMTDCLIKQAAIEVVPGVAPKHQADLDDAGFDMTAASPTHLAFYEYWKGRLLARHTSKED